MSLRSRNILSLKKLRPFVFLLSITVCHGAYAGGPTQYIFTPGPAGWNYYSNQNLLIGATTTLQSSANWGTGVTFGVIDTGITSSWVGFSGLNISSYNCVNSGPITSARCGAGPANSDDNSHGTFVASEMIGGVQFSNGNGMLGVAPLANMVAVKVLDASGSGSVSDVYNGIKSAVDHGARVLNLSLGPNGSAAEQSAFYNYLAPAINYAASKNAVIVLAGGNNGQLFAGGANITGFTSAALQRLLIMGSTNSAKKISSFSNTPGTGYFLSDSGQRFTTSYLWLMADGGDVTTANGTTTVEGLVGAPNVSNANYLNLSAGTSMAAPQGAGALGLLLARWPILAKNASATALLGWTATDLGTKGTDKVYGNGFINLTKAFQPYGALSVIGANGKSILVSNLTGAMITQGALGPLSTVSQLLSNYTVFDSVQRNFTADLSYLIKGNNSPSPAANQITNPVKTTTGGVHFANGSSLAFGNSTDESPHIDRPANTNDNRGWFLSFTDASGSTIAAGSGFPSAMSFADALWGNDTPVSGQVYSLGISNALMTLAQGGNFAAFGSQISADTRVAFSWSGTQVTPQTRTDWTKPDATSFGTGFTTNITEKWKAGMTFGVLNEQNGLLGTTYYAAGPLSLGDHHQSTSMGISSAFDLGGKRALLLDAAVIRTNGAQMSGGIVSDISPLYARTMGASLVQRDTVKPGDNLSFSVRAPMRVFSGSASLSMASVDSEGEPVITSQRANLAPSGHEMNFSVGYAAPVNENISWNLTMDARRDTNNVRGANDADILIGTKLMF